MPPPLPGEGTQKRRQPVVSCGCLLAGSGRGSERVGEHSPACPGRSQRIEGGLGKVKTLTCRLGQYRYFHSRWGFRGECGCGFGWDRVDNHLGLPPCRLSCSRLWASRSKAVASVPAKHCALAPSAFRSVAALSSANSTEPTTGIEPVTYALRERRSTD